MPKTQVYNIKTGECKLVHGVDAGEYVSTGGWSYDQPPVNPAMKANEPCHANPVDSHGVVWCSDFYTKNKSTTTKGCWKRKNGVDKASCKAYEAGFFNSED